MTWTQMLPAGARTARRTTCPDLSGMRTLCVPLGVGTRTSAWAAARRALLYATASLLFYSPVSSCRMTVDEMKFAKSVISAL